MCYWLLDASFLYSLHSSVHDEKKKKKRLLVLQLGAPESVNPHVLTSFREKM